MISVDRHEKHAINSSNHQINVFICAAIMCSGLPTPINGVLIYNTDTILPYDFGTVATYQCNLGYGLIVATNTRACNGDSSSTVGVWDGVDPGCNRKMSSNLLRSVHVYIHVLIITLTLTLTLHTVVLIIENEKIFYCTEFIWSIIISGITCSVLPLISNGGISYSAATTAPYDFTTTATYSCNDGFFLQGSDRRECTGDSADTVGEWSGSAPVCSGMITRMTSHMYMYMLT